MPQSAARAPSVRRTLISTPYEIQSSRSKDRRKKDSSANPSITIRCICLVRGLNGGLRFGTLSKRRDGEVSAKCHEGLVEKDGS
jgi:hypothetical protein